MTIDSHCKKCGNKFTAIGPPYDNFCPKCKKKIKKDKKLDWLTERRFNEKEDREYSLEERIAWIEEWIFENKELLGKDPLDITLL